MIDYRDMALKALVPGCQYASQNNEIFWDEEENNGVVCPSQEQIQAKIAELEAAEPMRVLRIERNQKLAETDWIITKGLEQGADITEWKTYRQALRDLPKMITPDDSTEPLPAPTIDQQNQLIFLHWPEVPE